MAAIVSQIVDVCVFRRKKRKVEFLVLQRSPEEKLYPNLWQILTGTIAPGETAIRTAIRELVEETSLPIKTMWTVPYIDTFFVTAEDTVHVSPVFAVEVAATAKVRLSSEHQQYEWLHGKKAQKKLVWPGQAKVIQIV
jgi:8-oxo-dGTP pyrophosphatase MutT (NUDIX family)